MDPMDPACCLPVLSICLTIQTSLPLIHFNAIHNHIFFVIRTIYTGSREHHVNS